jgi:hypothetical protein
MIPDTVEDGGSDVVGENVSEWGWEILRRRRRGFA